MQSLKEQATEIATREYYRLQEETEENIAVIVAIAKDNSKHSEYGVAAFGSCLRVEGLFSKLKEYIHKQFWND